MVDPYFSSKQKSFNKRQAFVVEVEQSESQQQA